jgi:hypothetical protein
MVLHTLASSRVRENPFALPRNQVCVPSGNGKGAERCQVQKGVKVQKGVSHVFQDPNSAQTSFLKGFIQERSWNSGLKGQGIVENAPRAANKRELRFLRKNHDYPVERHRLKMDCTQFILLLFILAVLALGLPAGQHHTGRTSPPSPLR